MANKFTVDSDYSLCLSVHCAHSFRDKTVGYRSQNPLNHVLKIRSFVQLQGFESILRPDRTHGGLVGGMGYHSELCL